MTTGISEGIWVHSDKGVRGCGYRGMVKQLIIDEQRRKGEDSVVAGKVMEGTETKVPRTYQRRYQ